MAIDLEATGTACIAFATSEHNGSARWTELSVYRLPDGKFLSQVQGKSSISGERTKTQRLASTSLERVLKLFADSDNGVVAAATARERSAEHTSELQLLMRISYAVFCLKKKNNDRILQIHPLTSQYQNQNHHESQ